MFDSLSQWIDQSSPWYFWGVVAASGLLISWWFYRGFGRLRLGRLIEDTPTSRIRSAHQGFVELEGVAAALPGEPVYAPLSGRECVWYDYTIDHLETRWHRDGRRASWVSVEKGSSEGIFALGDGTGRCMIDPEGAEIHPLHVMTWRGHERYPYHTPPGHSDFTGPYRYRERLIEPGDRLYALGWLETRREGAKGLADRTRELLRQWKRAPEKLLHRFDLNRDGRIDPREWEIVRRQAEKEALRDQVRDKVGDAVHVLRKPAGRGLPFILSSRGQPALVSACRRHAMLYLGLFVLGCGALAWAVQQRIS